MFTILQSMVASNNESLMMKDGKIDLAARQTYSLADAAQAHRIRRRQGARRGRDRRSHPEEPAARPRRRRR